MFNQITIIAEKFIAFKLTDIVKNMTKQEREDFVNSVRTLNVIAEHICRSE